MTMRVWMKVLGLSGVCCLVVTIAAARSAPPTNTAPGNQPRTPPGTQPGTQTGQNAPRFDVARFIKDHDKNGDGKLSKDELPASAQDEFSKMDTNQDGFVTADELQKHAHAMMNRRPELVEIVLYSIDVEEPMTTKELQTAYDQLRKLDKNHDGKIDETEVKAFREQRKKERIDNIFSALDKNHDGKIEKGEARGLWADNFDQLDKNKDGSLDKQEVEAACAMHVRDTGNPHNPGK
jgi:Ca2+-binding EF-hand superfamily protein